jgi:XTP/dITP diphosphohydrolase
MTRLIIATKNKGKVNEIKELLKGYDYEVVSMIEAGLDIDIAENGASFEENSLIKARAIHSRSKGMVVADDSGLEIDFLNGLPGIHSARFLGSVSDKKRYLGVLALLKDIPEKYRNARFRCAASLVTDTGEFTFCGTLEGLIYDKPVGDNGFGYDPVFYVPEYKQTLAEMGPELKNRISHRAKAFGKLVEKLKNWSHK